jgi:3-oxoacyl-[acyl-carrier protein] reductase
MVVKVSKQRRIRRNTMSKLANKVAVVTGASKGIGAEIAKSLAAEGAAVVVNYSSSKEGADKVVAAITAKGGKAIAVQGDVSKQADITRLFAETKKAFGRVDVLVNNAGVYAFEPLDQLTEETFHKQFNLNVLGVLLTTKEAAKYFDGEGGSVINISSAVTTIYPAGSATYTATKASLDAITVVLSKELGPRGIRVNAINPGMRLRACTQRALRRATSARSSRHSRRFAALGSRTISLPQPSSSRRPIPST